MADRSQPMRNMYRFFFGKLIICYCQNYFNMLNKLEWNSFAYIRAISYDESQQFAASGTFFLASNCASLSALFVSRYACTNLCCHRSADKSGVNCSLMYIVKHIYYLLHWSGALTITDILHPSLDYRKSERSYHSISEREFAEVCTENDFARPKFLH